MAQWDRISPGIKGGDCPTSEGSCLNKNRKNKNSWVGHTCLLQSKIQLQR
jgi:hypothetical protein